jgi:hypothetical protein
MKLPRRILYALAPLTAAAAALAVALPAQAIGPYHIRQENGSSLFVGSSDLNGGTAVKEVGSGSARNMYWIRIGTNSDGYNYGYWRFSNGNDMAATNQCDGVTIKTSDSSNGTVWILYIHNGHEYYIARYCDFQDTYNQGFLSGHNSSGTQWDIGYYQSPGLYQAITITAA